MHTDTVELAAENIAAVHRWLHDLYAPERWKVDQQSVHLAFSPGDSTCYGLVFGRIDAAFASGREHPRISEQEGTLGILSDTGGSGPTGVCIPVDLAGDPFPSYVADKIGTTNAFTVAAVGVVWQIMLGRDADHIAGIYAVPGQPIRVAEAIASWRA